MAEKWLFEVEVQYSYEYLHENAHEEVKKLATTMASQVGIVSVTVTQRCRICGEHVGKADYRKVIKEATG